MYQTILFDLDGTVSDPAEGITNSVMYALEKFSIHTADRTELYKFIGPPLRDSFCEFYHFSPEDAEKAVGYYREYYSEKGLYENILYPGMKTLLQTLKDNGRTVLMATSKPEVFASEILKYFHIGQYFDFVAGATLDSARNRKADVISYALEHVGIEELSSAVMVGDREHDIFGAKEIGIDSIGVLYGYGDREELQRAGATYIVSDMEEIARIAGCHQGE